MEKAAKSSAINFGLYLGITLALFIIIAYAVKLELLVGGWYSWLLFVLILVFGIISIIKAKGISGGFLSFKDSFTSYFITVSIGVLISTVVYYILFNFIDPEAAKELNQALIDTTAERMQRFGADENVISETMNRMDEQNNYSITNLLIGLAIQLAMYSIIGLIAAAFIKKNPENDY